MSDIPLLRAHLAWLQLRGQSPRTISNREYTIRQLDKQLEAGVTLATEDELMTWLANPAWSAGTRCDRYTHLTGFYRWAASPDVPGGPHLGHDPTRRIPSPRAAEYLPRPIADQELAEILTLSVDPVLTISILAAYSGLRCCEIAGLWREDVTETIVSIRRSKGGRPSFVATHSLVWRTVEPLPLGLVVESVGGIASAHYVSDTASRAYRRIGLDGVSPHRLRHWYGSRLRSGGADILVVQKAMRHRTVSSTSGYVAVPDREQWEAIQRLPVPGLDDV